MVMRGQGPSERGVGWLPTEGSGGRGEGEAVGKGREEGKAEALLKHLPACLTQEILKEEPRERKKKSRSDKSQRRYTGCQETDKGVSRQENQVQQREATWGGG